MTSLVFISINFYVENFINNFNIFHPSKYTSIFKNKNGNILVVGISLPGTSILLLISFIFMSLILSAFTFSLISSSHNTEKDLVILTCSHFPTENRSFKKRMNNQDIKLNNQDIN